MKIIFPKVDYSERKQRKKFDSKLVDMVTETVCKFYNVPIEDIRSKTRVDFIAKPRHVLFYFLRQAEMPVVAIAKHLKLEDHTTILHGSVKVSKLINDSPHSKREIEAIIELLNKNQTA